MNKLSRNITNSIMAFSTTIGDLTDKDKLVVRGSVDYLEHCFIDTIHVLEKSKKPSGI